LGPEVPYLGAIGVLTYLANCTWPDIAFAVNYWLGTVPPPLEDIGLA
jgi:hypothetical protein